MAGAGRGKGKLRAMVEEAELDVDRHRWEKRRLAAPTSWPWRPLRRARGGGGGLEDREEMVVARRSGRTKALPRLDLRKEAVISAENKGNAEVEKAKGLEGEEEQEDADAEKQQRPPAMLCICHCPPSVPSLRLCVAAGLAPFKDGFGRALRDYPVGGSDSKGSEVILDNNSQIHIYGNSGISTIGGVHPKTITNNPDGTMDIEKIVDAIRHPYGALYYPTTRLIFLEDTHANCGGKCLRRVH